MTIDLKFITFYLMLYASLCYAGDFREGHFGMSLEEIKALEPDFHILLNAKFYMGLLDLQVLKP